MMTKNLEVIYGRHSVRAVILTRPADVKRVVIYEGRKNKAAPHTHWTGEYLKLVQPAEVEPQIVPWREFLHLTGLRESDKHQGICVFAEPRQVHDENDLDDLSAGHLVVALDQISNPRNLGTILRTCGFFGVDAVLLLRNSAADITPEVLRIASGGAEFVKIFRVTNLKRSLKKLKDLGYWIYGLDERGSDATEDTDFDVRSVLVIGAEGGGLRHMTKKSCDFLVRIPGGRDGIESLNAAVAASIALGEFRRRMRLASTKRRTDASSK